MSRGVPVSDVNLIKDDIFNADGYSRRLTINRSDIDTLPPVRYKANHSRVERERVNSNGKLTHRKSIIIA